MVVSQFQVFDEEMAAFATQLGIHEIQMNTPALPGEKVWAFEDIKDLKDRIQHHGLKLVMIENIPLIFYDRVILGLPGRDEQIANYITTIRNLARLDIRLFGHHFSPTFVWRTDDKALGRGNSKVSEFRLENLRVNSNAFTELMRRKRHLLDYDVFEVARGLTTEHLFENYAYFMKAVTPVAEEEGVKLLLHPDDPPLKEFNGIQRMVTSREDYEKAMVVANSDAWGANLCLGCCSEMGGADAVRDLIRFFTKNHRLYSVHFRDVQGILPNFKECFLGEGNFNPAEIIKLLAEEGFEGLIMEDHVAHMDFDSLYGHRARAHELGYIKGMLNMLDFVPSVPHA
jgi:mannonate dehydratase